VGTSSVDTTQPLFPDDPTKHLRGPIPVSAYPGSGDFDFTASALHQGREVGAPRRPKRDTFRNTTAWPLRYGPLPTTWPHWLRRHSSRVLRAMASVRGRPRTGRLRSCLAHHLLSVTF